MRRSYVIGSLRVQGLHPDGLFLATVTTVNCFLLLSRIRPTLSASSFSFSALSSSSSSSAAAASTSLSSPSSFAASSSHSRFCSVYSHNSREWGLGKDFFVCCANPEPEPCHGLTYQKPSRAEAFCRGQIVDDLEQHWIQQETDFGNHGYFYCGGCCGQHMASDECNEEWQGSREPEGCFNWVLCFMKRCQKVNENIALGRHLKCSVPPPPYPKHYVDEPRTLPVNYSFFLHPRTDYPLQGQSSTGCSKTECMALKMELRCQKSCCLSFCCLQDGSTGARGRGPVGLSVVQMLGVVAAMVAFVVGVVALSVWIAKRCTNIETKQLSQDSRVLVIEEQEEEQMESDVESV